MAARGCGVPDTSSALLTVAEMAEADRLTIARGTPGFVLMHNAGAAVAAAIQARWTPCHVAVLCGPGGNGGDGFVIARILSEAGYDVWVALHGDRAALKGDPALHAALWPGEMLPLGPDVLQHADLIVDAIFGAGLSRKIDGIVAETLRQAANSGVPIVAVDVPSGLFGDTGDAPGAAPACLTVTFFRQKPGHLLLPGRAVCGALEVAEIGIADTVLADIAPQTFENTPALWHHALKQPTSAAHKYTRGHALLWGGYPMTGAARLAARATARMGAGLVTVAVPAIAMPIYAASLLSIMVAPIEHAADLQALLDDKRISALLIGPGAGVAPETAARVLAMLATGRPIVLDADVFAVFRDSPSELFAAIAGPCVMTPHEGEFARVFHSTGSKLERARAAARTSGAVMVLKGADTVIAAPDGRAAINANAPPFLATAGAGDVLSGMILGLLTQGLPPFEAACAAVWLHGAAAASFGHGLIAEDLADLLPKTLQSLDSYINGGQS